MAVNGIEIQLGQKWRMRDGDLAVVSEHRPGGVECWVMRAAPKDRGDMPVWAIPVGDNGVADNCSPYDLVELIEDVPAPVPVWDDHEALTFAPLAGSPDPANPKDAIGATKLPVGLVPDTVSILAAMAFAEGASKYGAYNWRASSVRMSIYLEAMRRHQMKLWNGEWADKKTTVPHLASIIACAGIIEDARLCGKLVDDRPPAVDLESCIAEAEAIIKHVLQLNAHMHPKNWTQTAMEVTQ